MINYSHEVETMCCVKKGPHHDPAPIPEEGKWIASKQITDVSGYTHGIGWCAPQQAASFHSTLKTVLLRKLLLKQSVAQV